MLKIIGLSNIPVFEKNNSNIQDFQKNNNNNKIVGFNIIDEKLAKKLRKLKKLAKSRKNLLKSRNLPKINNKQAKLNILISNNKIIFNRLWLAYIKGLIF